MPIVVDLCWGGGGGGREESNCSVDSDDEFAEDI